MPQVGRGRRGPALRPGERRIVGEAQEPKVADQQGGSRPAETFHENTDQAEDQKVLKKVEGDLAVLFDAFSDGDVLQKFLENPLFNIQDKEKVLSEIAKKGKFNKVTAGFLTVLARNGRAPILKDTLYEIHKCLQERRGEAVAVPEYDCTLT